jgi:hypothetical protein
MKNYPALDLEEENFSFKPTAILSGEKDIPLLREDSVMIRNRAVLMTSQYVTININVRKPGTIILRSEIKLSDLNSLAGGTLEDARIKDFYSQYPKDLNKPVRNFLFLRNYPSTKPGSTIIVPKKNLNSKIRLRFAQISGMNAAAIELIGLIAILNK